MALKKALEKVCHQLIWPADAGLDHQGTFGLLEIIFLLGNSQRAGFERFIYVAGYEA